MQKSAKIIYKGKNLSIYLQILIAKIKHYNKQYFNNKITIIFKLSIKLYITIASIALYIAIK